MLLYSLALVWFAGHGQISYAAPERPWYPSKAGPCFADVLATLKAESLRESFRRSPTRGWRSGN